jgi:hypothetical protein
MSEKIIGSLNEHTLHLALKKYIEPDPAFHEVEYGPFVADIKHGNCICEIETTSFTRMKKKLDFFLNENEVTVVYPIAVKRWVVFVDPKTGEASERRRSPVKGRPSDVCSELFKIREYVGHPNFALKLVFIEELNYKRRKGKRSSVREDRIPLSFVSEMNIVDNEDYAMLVDKIPDGEFTAKEFDKLNRLGSMNAWSVIQILICAKVSEKVGKMGNAFIYRKLN